MSRARHIGMDCGHSIDTPCTDPLHWWNVSESHLKATDEQLELLASFEDVDIDELFEAGITQGQCLKRLREAFGQIPEIPEAVRKRRDKFREQRRSAPPCRLCGKEGDSTRHHFVNRWILRELESYERVWANRKENCIPVCIDCHRDLHDRNGTPKSIAHLLTASEKAFADRALTALSEERPKLLILIGRGSSSVYEARLIKDWMEGKFEPAEPAPSPEIPQVLAAVA
jgi:hypothetical protein